MPRKLNPELEKYQWTSATRPTPKYRKKYPARIMFTLSETMKQAIKDKVKAEGMSTSAWLRKQIKTGLDAQ